MKRPWHLSVVALAAFLWNAAGALTIDRTGLTGRYEFSVRFLPPGARSGGAADDPPDFFTAVQEQLGLKPRATRAPVDTLVIDYVERPQEN